MSSTATPDYADIAGQLFGIWDQMLDAGTFTVISGKPSDAEKTTRVLALAHHVRRLGAAALDLIESHGPLVAAPTIRSCFEYALTAMWIAQSTDAVQAWIAQDPASRRALQQSLRAADSDELRQIAEKVVGTDLLGIESNSTAQANKIVKMVADFDGGGDLYAHYRLLCGLTHASPMLTDFYLDLDKSSPRSNGYEFVPFPQEPNRPALVLLVASSMLWALSAMRFIRRDKNDAAGKVLRSRVRAAARELGMPPDYQLTAEAIARQDGQRWGSEAEYTPKSLRLAAKAKGHEYAFSQGTGSDEPAHYVWPVGTAPVQVMRFASLAEAADHIRSL
ncbi:DUF5677 domain-containing protein [Rhodococcus sp. NPDC047139]|uniref:DUF5677 domain-containing protein n=1 Tax=Rhodococcus sp. NPDC047139 TaxID=3155141 RepID=UPI0033EBD7A1